MLSEIGSRLTYANVMATGAMFVAFGGGAYALSGVPDRSGVFHGCVSKKTGGLRVVASARSCRAAKRRHGRVVDPGEFAIAWNQHGPAGKNGINGINGTNGTNGVDGATNLIVRTTPTTAGLAEAAVPCKPGERAVSGGASRADGNASGADSVTQSAPAIRSGLTARPANDGETANAWLVGVNNTAASANFVLYAVCASP